jgi:phytoene synthase
MAAMLTQGDRDIGLGHAASVADAFAYCERMAMRHYENFPVASIFLPRSLRPSVCAIYAFARTADDYADEGSSPPEVRLEKLSEWGRMLDDSYRGRADHPVFIALAETAAKTGIPKQLLADLLTAFRMDVTKTRFQDFVELEAYCRFSANPVGRLVLHLFQDIAEENLLLSDKICTGLQLANFWQDFSEDRKKGRLYVPLEDMRTFGYTEEDVGKGVVDGRFVSLMKFQVDRARRLLAEGAPLVWKAVKPLRFELRLTVGGGMAILNAVAGAGYEVFDRRPALSVWSKVVILTSALVERNSWNRPLRR